MRALPRSVRYVLWLTTGARLLSGFLTLFLGFLMREHPLPGWAGPTVLALVIGTAGLGNATGSFIGNRRNVPAPEVLATTIAAVAVAGALVTALLGDGADGDVRGAVATVATAHPLVEFDIRDGGQPHHSLLLGAE